MASREVTAFGVLRAQDWQPIYIAKKPENHRPTLPLSCRVITLIGRGKGTPEAQISGTVPVACSVFEGAYDADVRYSQTQPADGVQN